MDRILKRDPSRSVLIIVNPASGRGRGARLAETLSPLFRQVGIAVEVGRTQRKGDADRMVREAAGGTPGCFDCIVACGGDGTVQEVAGALAAVRATTRQTCPMMAVAPAGRCNDFARSLGIRLRPADIVAAVEKGETRAVDLGIVNGRYFCTIAAGGIDAQVSDFVDHMWVPLRGTLAYVFGAVSVLSRSRHRRVILEGDFGRVDEPLLIASVANTCAYGGGIRLVPQADASDGMLDICLIEAVPRRRILTLLPRVFAGRHTLEPEVRFLKTRRVTLQTDPPTDIWADGERVTASPATIEVAPSAIQVVVIRSSDNVKEA